MKVPVFLCLSLVFGMACQSTRSDTQVHRRSSGPPNVIFIMADDLGYGDLGSYGQQSIQTPGLDQMAAEGMRFTDAYAGAPVCAPSRSVLMTGQHTGHTKVRGNFSAIEVPELPEPRRIPLGKSDLTVAEMLKQKGYMTGMFGKWGLGEATTTGEPNAKGYDEWLGFNNQRRAHTHYPDFFWKNRDTFLLAGNQNGQRTEHTHELFSDYALDFIDRHRDTSFFLYLPYCLPHDELAATARFEAMYADSNWTAKEKTYAAMVAMIDTDVARILNKLMEANIAENTVVFFCSDNGAARRWEGRFDSSGPLRGRKRDMYEGGIRTPMIAWMPGTVPAGLTSDYPWYFPDLMPTLAELADAEGAADTDGHSIVPVLKGEQPAPPDRFMYWEFHEKGFDQAVRWGNWKAVRHGLEGPLELYDLNNDLSEATDISMQHPEVITTLETYLKNARTQTPYWPAGAEAPRD